MESKHIILIFLFLIYLIYTIIIQRKIIVNTDLSSKRKVLNSLFIWVIPFLWYYMVKDSLTIDIGPMTKSKREKLRKKKGGGFYESGIGMSGE